MTEKKKLFEIPKFNDRSYAQKEAEKAKLRMKLANIGLGAGVFYQIVIVCLVFFDNKMPAWLQTVMDSDIVGGLALICFVVAAVLGVGLIDLIKIMWKFLLFFFWMIPIIPINLVCLLIGIMVVPISFIWCPLIYVIIHYSHIKSVYNAAMEFLSLEQAIVNSNQTN